MSNQNFSVSTQTFLPQSKKVNHIIRQKKFVVGSFCKEITLISFVLLLFRMIYCILMLNKFNFAFFLNSLLENKNLYYYNIISIGNNTIYFRITFFSDLLYNIY